MKARIALAMATMLSTCPLAFWLYGEGRTMCETIGLNTRAIIAGLLIGVYFPALTISLALFAVWRFRTGLKSMTLLSMILGIGIGLLTGSILSEWWILVDESRFISEMREAPSGMPYGRPRAWPNEGCSLVCVPGAGIHATD